MGNRRFPARAALAAAVLAALTPAAATTIIVDGTVCTLNDAITAANNDVASGGCLAGSGRDTLQITTNLTVSGVLPQIASDMDIVGDVGSPTISQGASGYRLFFVGGSGVAPSVSFQNLTLSNNAAQGGGGSHGAR